MADEEGDEAPRVVTELRRRHAASLERVQRAIEEARAEERPSLTALGVAVSTIRHALELWRALLIYEGVRFSSTRRMQKASYSS